MIYASILKSDGHHAEFHGDGLDEGRSDIRMENGMLVVHVREGDNSLRLRIGGEQLRAFQAALAEAG